MRLLEQLTQDMRFAGRQFARSPQSVAVAIVSVAIAIGVNAAILALVDTALLRPLPYPNAATLVRITGVFARLPLRATETGVELAAPVTAPELDASRAFMHLGSYTATGVNAGIERPERLRAAAVTPGFFAALNAVPAVGRGFTSADLLQTTRVAVISFRLWHRRFRGDSGVLSQTISLNGRPFQILGVMPDRADFPDSSDVWIPPGSDAQVAAEIAVPGFVARLAPGITAADARRDVLQLIQASPLTRQDVRTSGLTVTPFIDALTGQIRPILLLIAAAAALVWVIACLNTTNLLLVRVAAREREFAVRRAVGASRRRLVQQMLCESLMFATVASVLSIPVAMWTTSVARAFMPPSLQGLSTIGTADGTFVLVGVLSLISAVVFGLAPAIAAARSAPTFARAVASTTDDRVGRRFRSALVTLEIAIAVAILVAAATIVRTMSELTGVDVGARNQNAVVMELTLPKAKYASSDRIQAFHDALRSELRAVAGVDAVGATTHLPGDATGIVQSWPMAIEGMASRVTADQYALHLLATPGYFSALAIDVLAGRPFLDTDRAGGAPVAIVSERFARAFGLTPLDLLGRRVDAGLGNQRWAEIIGVVRDVRMRGPESAPEPAIYVPFAQVPPGLTSFVVVKTSSGFADVEARIRSAVTTVDPTVPLYNIRTFRDVQSEYLASREFARLTMVAFGSVAFALAALGLYGVISYWVRLRTREIAIRLAVGAPPALMLRQVLGRGAAHAVVGIALGLATAVASWRFVSAHVPGLGHIGAARTTVLCLSVFFVSTAATWLPARRAARVDSLVALRTD